MDPYGNGFDPSFFFDNAWSTLTDNASEQNTNHGSGTQQPAIAPLPNLNFNSSVPFNGHFQQQNYCYGPRPLQPSNGQQRILGNSHLSTNQPATDHLAQSYQPHPQVFTPFAWPQLGPSPYTVDVVRQPNQAPDAADRNDPLAVPANNGNNRNDQLTKRIPAVTDKTKVKNKGVVKKSTKRDSKNYDADFRSQKHGHKVLLQAKIDTLRNFIGEIIGQAGDDSRAPDIVAVALIALLEMPNVNTAVVNHVSTKLESFLTTQYEDIMDQGQGKTDGTYAGMQKRHKSAIRNKVGILRDFIDAVVGNTWQDFTNSGIASEVMIALIEAGVVDNDLLYHVLGQMETFMKHKYTNDVIEALASKRK